MKLRMLLTLSAAILTLVATRQTAFAVTGDTLVTVGSPASIYDQNLQNEPSVAVDPLNPLVLAAGANDFIDDGICTISGCFFASPSPGLSGVYFSFNGGSSWTQPTYTGWSGRTGTGMVGPIGTLPRYFENGLLSNEGDPVLAFGPRPSSTGTFSWANGVRLYYLNVVANFSSQPRRDETFLGVWAIALSRTDNLAAAAAGNNSAWFAPVIVVTRSSAVTFSDKPGFWADNASSSPFFGNVYACWTSFRGNRAEPIEVSRSTDGGATWSAPKQLTAAFSAFPHGARQGCMVRTDSTGIEYVFWEGSAQFQSAQLMARSFDGGISFEMPRVVALVTDVGAFDPVQSRLTFDGVLGARTNSFPSVDIANGAPTGIGATNEIVLAWSDARNGLNHEQALVQFSLNRGVTWSAAVNGAPATDRPDFPAVAISPNGQNVYLTYMAFLDPWRSSVTSGQRRMQGVVNHANATLGGWSTLHRGVLNDARGAGLRGAEFLGDYNSVVATNTFGAALWNDVRNATLCPAILAARQSFLTANPLPLPNPATACPPGFGNSNIYGGVYAP